MHKAKLIFPCKVNWDAMTPAEAGRFCAECKKVVQDYTKRSLQDAPAETFCGRFNPGQVDFHTSGVNITNRTALAVSLFTLLGIPAMGQTSDEAGLPAKFDPALPIEFKSDTFKFSNLHFPLLLEGRLRSRETHQPLQNARVTLLQQGRVIHTAQTDNAGRFSFTLQQNDLHHEKVDIAVFHEGRETSNRPDSLFQLPLTSDTVKAGNVFALEFMVKPIQPLTRCVPQTSLTVHGGVVSYQWHPDNFKEEPLGGTFVVVPNLKPVAYTVQTVAMETLTLTTPQPKGSGKKYTGVGALQQESSVTSPVSASVSTKVFWKRVSIATLIAILLGFFLRRKKTKSQPDKGKTE